MTEASGLEGRSASRRPVSPERAAELAVMNAAWRKKMGPEAGAAQLARLLAVPAELLVPLVRLARGQRGAALMPSAVGQLNAFGAAVVVGATRRANGRPLDTKTREDSPPQPIWKRAVLLAAIAYGLLGPFWAARSERVVLADRSPLWAYPLQGLLTLPLSVAMLTTLIKVSRRARDEHRETLAQEPAA